MRPLMRWCPIFVMAMSCVGTDVGNPPDDRRVTGTLEFAAHEDGETGSEEEGTTADAPDTATNAEPGGVKPSGLVTEGGTDVEAVWFSITEITVRDCADDTQRTIEGPWTVDLLDGTVYPDRPVLTESPAEFCTVRLKLASAAELPEAAPAELSGNTLWLRGATDAGSRLTIASQGQRVLTYDGEDFVVDGEDGATIRFIAAFEPDGWFKEIEGGTMPDVPVELNDSGEMGALSAFWAAFVADSRLVPDLNTNGRVDVSEYDAPVAVPRQ